ncbi:MAG TPA: hypothetical protein VFM31_07315 [Nitrososphaeraceae archaeon]|nr:hypothetical protein [Nitrososphaeraceae archaeon]
MVNDLERSTNTERSSELNRGDDSDESIKSSYSCETCNQSFNSKLELKKHSSSQH